MPCAKNGNVTALIDIAVNETIYSPPYYAHMSYEQHTNVAIIGGGFYGAFVASEVKAHNPKLDVTILEKEAKPFTQASSTNQGQFHMGYMYSGDQMLAGECTENISRFYRNFNDAVDHGVNSLYGIHKHSEISAQDYAAFCEDVGLPLEIVDSDPRIFGAEITRTFATREKTFNSSKVQETLLRKLALQGVKIVYNFDAGSVDQKSDRLHVTSDMGNIRADHIFNVTFADINTLHEKSGLPLVPLQHDSFLHFVVDLPDEFKTTAATVVRGPYASLLPSSFRGGHILASGVYRKVCSSRDHKPEETVTNIHDTFDKAIRESAAYLPITGLARYKGYTLGTRAAYAGKENYTSKAMVFQNYAQLNGYHVVLGGKVSCLFDVIPAIHNALDSSQ